MFDTRQFDLRGFLRSPQSIVVFAVIAAAVDYLTGQYFSFIPSAALEAIIIGVLVAAVAGTMHGPHQAISYSRGLTHLLTLAFKNKTVSLWLKTAFPLGAAAFVTYAAFTREYLPHDSIGIFLTALLFAFVAWVANTIVNIIQKPNIAQIAWLAVIWTGLFLLFPHLVYFGAKQGFLPYDSPTVALGRAVAESLSDSYYNDLTP